mmetsp:Transcript_7856/g.15190  ORF Transcript_7856/g.15190 Transcript_7856/m.15190 type:complete len:213 (+) Transcript_7856:77-715(+)
MANFGELVLVLGDMHIPQRASKIPAAFKRMLVPNKMQHVICTGNISQEQYEELRGLAPNLHIVAGEFDGLEPNSGGVSFPETRVLQVGSFRIGVVHGHQLIPWQSKEAIERMRRKLDVDVIVTGHTHQNEVNVQEEDYYHINPGSITGAYSSLTEDVTPSFILLAVQDTKVICYVYELVDDQVEVSKTEFSKKTGTEASSKVNSALMQSLLT